MNPTLNAKSSAATILFIGDIVGQGVDYLERELPGLRARLQPDFIVANAENIELPPMQGRIICGMSPQGLARLFAAGVDVVTGGNHSWDGPFGRVVHEDPRVLRPLNYSTHAPGRGSTVIEKNGLQLGVINLASRDALPFADAPIPVMQRQVAEWEGQTDAILVDFHGASTEEKLTTAYSANGRIAALVGTHTHIPTLDTRVLQTGTAYVSDVGMTGPDGGILGYDPRKFVATAREGIYDESTYAYAEGAIVLGAVLIRVVNGRAESIRRVANEFAREKRDLA